MSSLSNEPKAFVAKVFGTLAVQVTATTAAVSTIVNVPELNAAASSDPHILSAAFFSFVLSLYAREASSTAGKVTYLSLFTLVESWLIGVVCTAYADAGLGPLLLQAAGLVVFDVAVLASYALLSEDDFSYLPDTLRGALFALIGGSLVELGCAAVPSLAPLVPAQGFALSIVGTLVFSLFLVFDVAKLQS